MDGTLRKYFFSCSVSVTVTQTNLSLSTTTSRHQLNSNHSANMHAFFILALSFAGANASLLSRGLSKRQLHNIDERRDWEDHLESVCMPATANDEQDWNAPCNAIVAIEYQCIYGAEIMEALSGRTDDYEDPPMMSNETQRDCICQSQLMNQAAGCKACFKAHGGEGPSRTFIDFDRLEPLVNKYCNASATPTEAFPMVVYSLVVTGPVESTAAATTYSDPIGNATDVSRYFTPSMTGSAAWNPAMPTAESSGATSTYASVKTSDGQIVPLATDEVESGDGGSAATSSGASSEGATTDSGSGAVPTAMVGSGALGALGFAALVAAL